MTVCSPSDQQASQTGQRLGLTLSHEERKGSEVHTERVAVTPDTAIAETMTARKSRRDMQCMRIFLKNKPAYAWTA